VLLLGCAAARAAAQDAEKNLLRKYQQKAQKGKDQLAADVQAVLKKAKALEREDPEAALALVRDAREQLIGNQTFTLEEENKLFQPLTDRLAALKELIHEHHLRRMRNDLAAQKESVKDWTEKLEKTQQTGVADRNPALYAPKPVGSPAVLAYRNGTFTYALLQAKPFKDVSCTVDGRANVFLPSEVLGVKVQSGYYLYVESLGRYAYVTNQQAFILTAYVRLNPPPPELPGPVPPPIIQSTAAAVKPAAIDDLVKLVFKYGADNIPVYFSRDPNVVNKPDAAAMRAARDALIEAQVKNYLSRATKFNQNRFQEMILKALNGHPGEPLTVRERDNLQFLMEYAIPNAGQWPTLLLDYVNDVVQENQAPQVVQ
jgi:hypothetical protein